MASIGPRRTATDARDRASLSRPLLLPVTIRGSPHNAEVSRYPCWMSAWVPRPPEQPPSFLEGDRFRVLCEIEPPRKPDIDHVRDQIEVLKPVTDAFLIPDNHLGRATESSGSLAPEVAYMGGSSVACL